MTSSRAPLAVLSDDELLLETKRLVARECMATADLLRCLMEVDARRLYLREGCSSLFVYCTQVLHLAEGAAYNRIEAARLARRFTDVLVAIETGAVTLTSVRLLAPHMTAENYGELLAAATHKTKREVTELIAERFPQPPVTTVLRKLPERRLRPTLGPGASMSVRFAPGAEARDCQPKRNVLSSASSDTAKSARVAPSVVPMPVCTSGRAATLEPLSSSSYKLQVTLSAETHNKLCRARDLLRHAIPAGELASVLDRALTLLLKDLETRRCGAAIKPRKGSEPVDNTRHIPAVVKREVWRRDEGRCAFHGGGRRCGETAFLEFHHVQPFAEGGQATVNNIELRCRAHNQYEASLFFGEGSDAVRERRAAWPFDDSVASITMIQPRTRL